MVNKIIIKHVQNCFLKLRRNQKKKRTVKLIRDDEILINETKNQFNQSICE